MNKLQSDYREFFQRFEAIRERLLYSLNPNLSKEEKEDILQETIILIAEKYLHRLIETAKLTDEKFYFYMRQTCRLRAVDFLRRKLGRQGSKKTFCDQISLQSLLETEDPIFIEKGYQRVLDQCEAKELITVVSQVARSKAADPNRALYIIVQRHMHGRLGSDVAKELKITEQRVRQIERSILKTTRELLKPR